MIKKTLILLSCLVLFAMAVTWHSFSAKEQYYRGVYDMCIRSNSIASGYYTRFDQIVCADMETKARSENWYAQHIE